MVSTTAVVADAAIKFIGLYESGFSRENCIKTFITDAGWVGQQHPAVTMNRNEYSSQMKR